MEDPLLRGWKRTEANAGIIVAVGSVNGMLSYGCGEAGRLSARRGRIELDASGEYAWPTHHGVAIDNVKDECARSAHGELLRGRPRADVPAEHERRLAAPHARHEQRMEQRERKMSAQRHRADSGVNEGLHAFGGLRLS